MIKFDLIEESDYPDHFIVSADEPIRIEVANNTDGNVIAHVYRDTTIDTDQEPVGAYDSTIANESWQVD